MALAPRVTIPEPAQSHAATPPRYIRSHAALRGIAALLVVAYHLQFGTTRRLYIETATPFFQRGYLLVDLFFILSGFVISLTNDADRSNRFTSGETRSFFIVRFARIYPLHVFCLCCSAVVQITFDLLHRMNSDQTFGSLVDASSVQSFAAELFLVQAWIPGAPFWNIPSWSISAEVFAYSMFPLLVGLRSRFPPIIYLLFLLPAVFYLTVAFRTGSLDIIAGWAPLRCLSGFCLGMVLFYARHALSDWPEWSLSALQVIAGFCIIASMMFPTNDVVIIPFFAILVFTTWQDEGKVSHILSGRALNRMGDLSYSIYLTHVCVIFVMYQIWDRIAVHLGLRPEIERVLQLVTCFLAVILVSRWTYEHVECSARRYLRRVLSGAR